MIVLPTLLLLACSIAVHGTPESPLNWLQVEGADGIRFSPRNDLIWLIGGRTDLYPMYNLLDSYKEADVWSSIDGQTWVQKTEMIGDYWAQNQDVVQPGAIAPFYQRYGHSLDAVDTDRDGDDDLLFMMGGYAPNPSNDIWVSPDGNNWIFCGHAPWGPRAWHTTVTFKRKLYLMGGTPLNNEVWRLDSAEPYNRTIPLTRSLYSKISYNLTWTRLDDAPWSPRVGAQAVEQLYFNTSAGQHRNTSRNRVVLAGGYGGWLEDSSVGVYDGFYCRPDSWEFNGHNWTLLNHNNSWGGRAWFGMGVMQDPNRTNINVVRSAASLVEDRPPKMYIFGGGYIGFTTDSIKIVSEMSGKADGYFSYDGINWVKLNYEEGGGTSTMPFYSNLEWAKTIVDTNTKYLGNWGLTLEKIKVGDYVRFVLLAGDYTDGGDFSSNTYQSQAGLFCTLGGTQCTNKYFGDCEEWGCKCTTVSKAYGEYCEFGGVLPGEKSGALTGASAALLLSTVLALVCGALLV